MDSETGNDNPLCLPSERTFLDGQIVFEKFRVEAILGFGSSGQVYRVRDTNLDKALALKVLSEHGRDENALVRFQKEARSTSRLNHPAIATVYDFGLSPDGAPYLATEFIDGMTLESLLRDRGRLPLKEALDIILQVCDGLDCAHRNGVVHRDIKPGNIMISQSDDGACVVKVVDFGIARIVDDTAGGVAVTAPGRIMGTPKYISPEAIASGNVSAGSDLYSLGCVLYECLAGRPPFQCQSTMQLLFSHQSVVPGSLKELEGIDDGKTVSDIVDKLLAKRPADRYESALALKQALSSLLDQPPPPPESYVPNAEPSKSNSFSRHSWPVIIVFCVVSLLALGGFVLHRFGPLSSDRGQQTFEKRVLPERSPMLSELKMDMDRGKRSFSFKRFVVRDEDLKLFSDYQPLESLDLYGQTLITEKGLEHLRRLKNLRKLTLNETGVNDFSILANLSNLEELSLNGLEIDDRSIKNLSKLNRLKKLDLRVTPVTVDGLHALASLPNLVELLVDIKGVDGIESIHSLWKSYPDLKWLEQDNFALAIGLAKEAAYKRKDYQSALRHAKLQIEILEKRKPRNYEDIILRLLGAADIAALMNSTEQTKSILDRALAIALESKNPDYCFMPRFKLFMLMHDGDDVGKAEAAVRKVLPFVRRPDRKMFRDQCYSGMAVCCQRNRDWPRAEFWWNEALKNCPDDKKLAGAMGTALFIVYKETNRNERAYQAILKSIKAFEEANSSEDVRHELLLANYYASQFDFLRKHYRPALNFNSRALEIAKTKEEKELVLDLRQHVLNVLKLNDECNAVKARLTELRKQP